MSKISISLAVPTNDVRAIKLIRDVTKISLSSIKSRLQKGKKGVFYTTELFLNDHPQKDLEIRMLVSGFYELGLELFVMELLEDEFWEDVDEFENYQISSNELISLLDNCELYE